MNLDRFPSARRWRIVHTESSPGWGGQEHRVLAELTGFKQRGLQVALVAPPESELRRRALLAGIPVRPMRFSRALLPSNVLQLAAWLRRTGVDVLNPHSSRDAWVAGLAGRLARVPLIVRTRHFDVPIPSLTISRYVYKTLSDHILTTSPKVSEHLRLLFNLPEDRISTVPTGIDLERFSPAGPKAELAPAAQPPGIPAIGMISVIRLAKGHETLLRAARLLKNRDAPIHCVIVGEGPYRPNVEQLVRDLGLSESVSFLGHREDVPEILRALKVLVIPSLHEGIPQVALQSLATQTPVIGSDVGGIPAILLPNRTGRLFPPGDFASLAAAIGATLEETSTTRRLAEQGRAFVETEHSLKQMLDKLEAIYCRHLAV
ncbi:MAG: glycosyltransferase family 4 protein [Verrucomicrobiales bacterium]|nr:glycosyltransferase family 4 protein [Verrucomicrobiales bacterium]